MIRSFIFGNFFFNLLKGGTLRERYDQFLLPPCLAVTSF